jgi:hypothetical protein
VEALYLDCASHRPQLKRIPLGGHTVEVRRLVKQGAVTLFALAALGACGRPRGVPEKVQPLAAKSGMLSGVVHEGRSQTPLSGARIVVVGTPLATNADNLGRFVLGPLSPGPHTLRVAYLGYTPTVVSVTIPDTGVTHLELAMRYPGDGPLVDSALVLPVWEAVLARYRPVEGAHVRETSRITGTPPGSSNTDRSRVVLLDTLYGSAPSGFLQFLDTLVAKGYAGRVCHNQTAGSCPDTVFTTFLSLGIPRQDSPDTVAVTIEETAINPRFCRRGARGTSFGGTRSSTLLLVRVEDEWRVIGPAGIQVSGTLICGHS